MKIARIYIRVSTTEQALEGYSITTQKEKLIAYCKAKDYFIDDIYVDGGFSGANLERPGLQKLLKDIEKEKTDAVIVYRLDRLSRSQKDTLYLIEDIFLPKGIAFISMQESFDTSTPFGRAMVGILSVFAQLERENIKERTMSGKVERAKAGLWGGGIDPFGYDYIPEKDMLIPNANAGIVKKAYELYLQGYGTPRIAKELGGIDRSKVRAWLKAPVYAGKIAHAGKIYPGQHEPIVSWETFLQVQEVMEQRSRKRGKSVSVNVLAGLVKCKQCGALYGSRKGHNCYYLACYSRTGYIPEMVKKKGCRNKIWRMDALISIVEKEVFSLAYNEDAFRQKLQEKRKERIDKKKVEGEIQAIDRRMGRLLDLMLDEELPIQLTKKKVAELDMRKTQLEKLLEEDEGPISQGLIEDATITIRNSWPKLSVEKKNELLRRLIEVIWVDEGDIEIVWRF